MYIEEPKKRIDWGNLLKKGLIVLVIAAVVFLIIWLFARNNSNAIDVNYGENNININNVLTNPNSYSEKFINNYRYFHDTAKEYFLISELPTKGNTLKYTLQNLIDKELILPFSNGDGTCDTEASYVMVKNDNGEYKMTVTLVCGSEVAKTTEELGCNQLCNNGTCTPEEIEYQFKQAYKATETVYSCPSGYTKTGTGANTKCVKDNSSTVNANKDVTYICPSGYTKTGTGANTKCTKGSSSVINANKDVTYICPSGYTKTGTGANTKCYKKSETSVAADYKYSYSCSEGKLNGTKCTITSTSTVNAKANTTYSCSEGKLNGTKCTITNTSSVNATPKTTYSCSEGTLVNEKYCRINTKSSYYQSYTLYKGKTYNGCTYSGSYTDSCSSYSGCTRTYYKYYCNKSSYKDVEATANTTYNCSNGYLSGTKCIITNTSTVNAKTNTTYSCSEGKLDGNKCIITNTTTKDANKTKNYYCEDGYSLDGNKCYKTTNVSTNATVNTSYSCPSGYDKSNTKCISNDKVTINAIKNTQYTCNEGYTKLGSGTSTKCTKGSNTTLNPTKSTKTVTKYKYKWSSETSLDGWERTGKTRKVSSN